MKEELDRKNQKITTMESLLEDMNKKINEQQKYIDILENSQKETEKQFLIQSQKNMREHENLMKNLSWKDKELKDFKMNTL